MNREFGSDFHYVENQGYRLSPDERTDFFEGTEQFYFSGRAALRAVVAHGISVLAWKRIYVPTYYCHEVYDFINDLDIQIEFYECNPLNNIIPPSLKDSKDYAVLTVNYFGIAAPDFSHLSHIAVIEDLTHNLDLIKYSKADYVFGSLRKVLPLPAGGFVKSRYGLTQPPVTSFAEKAVLEKFAGMLLKSRYLRGEMQEKDVFRNLLIEAEHSFENLETFVSLSCAVKEYMSGLDIQGMISSKKQNALLIKDLLEESTSFDILTAPEATEYALILKFTDIQSRDNLKKYLIRNSIYPFVLWPDQLKEADKHIEDTLLFVHIDFRYSEADIRYIADIINKFDPHV